MGMSTYSTHEGKIFKANGQRLKLYHGVPQDPKNTKIALHDLSD
ncbi:unnamed protein product [Rhodiola kirilowii]